MFGGIRKVPTSCPHCGFVQNEPAGLISTYCRGCGDHYSVRHDATALPNKPPAARHPPPASHFGDHRVECDNCGLDHPVSPNLHFTQCPNCGTSIDLADIEVTTHSTRSIDTRGTVHVRRGAYLNGTRTVCKNALIEGQFAGRIECSGTLRLRGTAEPTSAQIRARTLIIDRGSKFRFRFPIRAEEILIRGHVEADVQCPGTIRVGRYGWLEGQLRARSLVVDKGGGYEGSVEVATTVVTHDPERNSDVHHDVRVMPAWRSFFASA